VMEGKLQECRGSLRRLLRCVPTPTPARFPKAEEQLYSEFSARRKMGLPVGELWFVNKMKRFVKFWYPDASFEASHGWFQNFCARHNLVSRRKKNSKMESVEQRIGLIQRFHAAVQRDVLPTTPAFIATRLFSQGRYEVALLALHDAEDLAQVLQLAPHRQLAMARLHLLVDVERLGRRAHLLLKRLWVAEHVLPDASGDASGGRVGDGAGIWNKRSSQVVGQSSRSGRRYRHHGAGCSRLGSRLCTFKEAQEVGRSIGGIGGIGGRAAHQVRGTRG
jgi:hypothetical protein